MVLHGTGGIEGGTWHGWYRGWYVVPLYTRHVVKVKTKGQVKLKSLLIEVDSMNFSWSCRMQKFMYTVNRFERHPHYVSDTTSG